MIEKLTKTQEQQLIEFREEYLRIGLSTQPINKEKSIKCMQKIYQDYLSIKSPYFWFCDSPMQAHLVINILKNEKLLSDNLESNLKPNLWSNLGDNLWSNLRSNLGDNLWSNLGDNLWSNLGDNLESNLGSNLRSNLGDNLGSNLWSNLWSNLRFNLGDNLRSNLWSNLGSNLRSNLGDNLGDNLGFYDTELYGPIESFWVAFYMFPKKFLGIDYGEKLNEGIENMDQFVRNCGIVYTFKDICFICENPVEINKKGIQLHGDGKPSIRYKDGYEVYTLNGINVPDWLAMTSPEKLTIEQYNDIENADVRTEFVRKFGVDRMIDMGTVIDDYTKYNDPWWTTSEYKLIDMACLFEGIDFAPHLFCKNQTVKGVYHLEAVSPKCRNLVDAMNERYSNDMNNFQIVEIK